MKKHHRIFSTFLVVLLVVSCLLIPSSAISNEIIHVPTHVSTQMEYVLVQNGEVHSLPCATKFEQSIDIIETPVAVEMTTYFFAAPDYIEHHISCENIQQLSDSNDKLALAEHVLENYLGYTEYQISSMSLNQRLKIGFASNITSQQYRPERVVLADVSDELVSGDFTYRLNFSSSSSTKGVASLTATCDGAAMIFSTGQFASICAQNVACVSDSSEVSGAYYGGLTGATKYTLSYDENSSNYTPISATGGTGIKYDLSIPGSTDYNAINNISVTTTVDLENSSVQPGGAFNVYGNFAFKGISIGGSVSFPWGFTPTISSSLTNNKTQVTARF